MKLGKIVLKLRLANTRFGIRIAGAAELESALNYTLSNETAFVIYLGEDSKENKDDNMIDQEITERFGIICCVKCDSTQSDKTGLIAMDALYDVRSDLFKAILGWQMQEATSVITYRGGKFLGIDGAYLWFQYEFEFKSSVVSLIEEFRDIQIVLNNIDEDETTEPNSFDRLYSNFVSPEDERLPYTGDLPLPDGFPDVLIPDIASMINFDSKRRGGFAIGFGSAFDFYNAGNS
jgi:hypothetical protein